MTPADKMRKGALEANHESDAAAMGRAVGSLTAFIAAILDLQKRVDRLDQRLTAIDAALAAGKEEK